MERPKLTFDAPVDLSFEPAPAKQTAGVALGIVNASVRTRAARRRFYDLSRVPNAARLITPLPAPGETIHALMGGDFHAWDLVPAIAGQLSVTIAELYVTTLGFNHANNQHLCEMLDAGAIGSAFILCSEYFRDADNDVYTAAERRLAERGSKIKAVRNHSKVMLIRPASGPDRYALESSANLRSCNNLEQFALTNDAALFEFHRGWITAQFQ
jgi:hypothetical protein